VFIMQRLAIEQKPRAYNATGCEDRSKNLLPIVITNFRPTLSDFPERDGDALRVVRSRR
jgi:hypothetical protein